MILYIMSFFFIIVALIILYISRLNISSPEFLIGMIILLASLVIMNMSDIIDLEKKMNREVKQK